MPKRVLVIDAIATHRIRLSALLDAAQYAVDTAEDHSRAPQPLQSYDIVLLGLPRERPGQLIAAVVQNLRGGDAPILCFDRTTSPLRRLLAMRAGGRDVLPANAPDDLVLALVRSLIRQGEAEREATRRRLTAASFGFADAAMAYQTKARVLCVGALGYMPDRLAALLPHQILSLPDGSDLREHMATYTPDAIVLGVGPGHPSLRHVLPELRDQTHLSPVPIMAIYPETEPHLATEALALGASETMTDAAGLEELELRITHMLRCKAQDDALRRSNEQSFRLAVTDALTGLYNRHYADVYLTGLASRSEHDRSEFCVLLIDLDHFKAVNDTYGHAAGDAVLRTVAGRLKDNLRACDLVARYGGEEFLVILPETSRPTATLLAERLRCAIAAQVVSVSDQCEIPITASIGVAGARLDSLGQQRRNGMFGTVCAVDNPSFQMVFDAADAALYRAKSAGRDRVEVSAA